MERTLFLSTLLVVFAGAVMAQGPPQPVEVVNLPAVQQVAGEELHQSHTALVLLLMRAYGVLPEGINPPEAEECEISGIPDLVEYGVTALPAGPSACDLQAYAATCVSAAELHRDRCAKTCGQFKVIHAERQCRGTDRPTIEAFSEPRHCFRDRQNGPSVTCVVRGWCACDP